jgi:hypothetical protein
MEHTTPICFPEDENFDIGQDTRTGVAMVEYRYECPFKFTGKINKVTFELGPELLTEEEHKHLPEIAHAVAWRRTKRMKKRLVAAPVAEVTTGGIPKGSVVGRAIAVQRNSPERAINKVL